MTHIASYPTKKAFKEAVAAYLTINPVDGQRQGRTVYLDDPSIFNPCSGSLLDIMAQNAMITVTNHPKRSWFACVKKIGDKIKVE